MAVAAAQRPREGNMRRNTMSLLSPKLVRGTIGCSMVFPNPAAHGPMELSYSENLVEANQPFGMGCYDTRGERSQESEDYVEMQEVVPDEQTDKTMEDEHQIPRSCNHRKWTLDQTRVSQEDQVLGICHGKLERDQPDKAWHGSDQAQARSQLTLLEGTVWP